MRVGIIGGGVCGTAIAYFLAERGVDEVILFERESIGGVSTAKSAGIVRQHYSHDVQIRIAKRGRDILEAFEELIGRDGGFTRNGYLIMADEANADQFRRNVERQRRAGVEVELVPPAELSDHVAAIDPDGIAVAAKEPTSGYADPYLVASGFGAKADELGADLRPGTPVTDIEVDDGTVESVRTPDGSVPVDLLVNAGGPYGREVGRMVGLDLPLERYEAKIIVLTADREFGADVPTVSDIGSGMYAKPEPGGEFVVGGVERADDHRGLEGETDMEGVTNRDLRRVGDFIDHRLPGYADARVVETWSGIITATPDWHQIVGVPAGYENVYNVVGHSGHGFKEAPAFGESIAREILGEEPRHDLDPYRLERFETGDTFRGGYDDPSRG